LGGSEEQGGSVAAPSRGECQLRAQKIDMCADRFVVGDFGCAFEQA
jgi:hypothetical protein